MSHHEETTPGREGEIHLSQDQIVVAKAIHHATTEAYGEGFREGYRAGLVAQRPSQRSQAERNEISGEAIINSRIRKEAIWGRVGHSILTKVKLATDKEKAESKEIAISLGGGIFPDNESVFVSVDTKWAAFQTQSAEDT